MDLIKNNISGFKKSFVDIRRRMLDLTISSMVLPSAAALSTVAAITSALSGNVKVLKKEKRVGLDGKTFYVYSIEAPKSSRNLAWFSEILKRVHAYEIPIVFNIFKGDMALVGPEAISEDQLDNLEEHEYARFAVRPGLTDIYKIRKRMNIAFEGKSVLEKSYLAERGVLNDLSILARTVPALILGSSNPVHADSFVLQDINISNLSMRDSINKLMTIKNGTSKHIAFVNPHCFNVAGDDDQYKEILEKADIVFPDGIGIKLAGFMIGAEVRENVNGTDMFPRLCDRAQRDEKTLFLLGSKPGISEQVKRKMTERFPGLKVVGTWHGYFEEDSKEEDEIISAINHARPDFLLVAKGVPGQEKWIDRNLGRLDVGVVMGVGGLFDFYSGRIERAPGFVRELGLEWFWRFLQEPQRMYKRYFIGNPKFLVNVWRWYISQASNQLIKRFDGIDAPGRRFRVEMGFQTKRFLYIATREGSLLAKRAIDIMGASVALSIFSPMYASIALAIKLEDPKGPVFFHQYRVGRQGRIFKMYKFRSMIVNADKLKDKLKEQNESGAGVIFKMADDPRITRVGKIIRRFSLDETPQLWNVFVGDMSLVGPRPPLPSEVAEYQVMHRDRLEVIPGLTCIWQVSGRSLLDFNQQVQFDREYIQNQSFWGDIKLILKTIPVVMSGYGAY